MQPFADCLAAYPEEARRFGLAESPYLDRARERTARTPTIEALGEGVKPSALMPVRSKNLLGCFVRGQVLDGRDSVLCFGPPFAATLCQPQPNVNHLASEKAGQGGVLLTMWRASAAPSDLHDLYVASRGEDRGQVPAGVERIADAIRSHA